MRKNRGGITTVLVIMIVVAMLAATAWLVIGTLRKHNVEQGLASLERGDYTQAALCLEKAARYSLRPDAAVLFHLAEARLKLGRHRHRKQARLRVVRARTRKGDEAVRVIGAQGLQYARRGQRVGRRAPRDRDRVGEGRRGILADPREELGVRVGDALRRRFQPRAVGVFPDRREDR